MPFVNDCSFFVFKLASLYWFAVLRVLFFVFHQKFPLVASTAGLTILLPHVFTLLSITDQWRVSIGYYDYGLQCKFGQGYFIFNPNISKQVCCCLILWKDVRHFTNILWEWECWNIICQATAYISYQNTAREDITYFRVQVDTLDPKIRQWCK